MMPPAAATPFIYFFFLSFMIIIMSSSPRPYPPPSLERDMRGCALSYILHFLFPLCSLFSTGLFAPPFCELSQLTSLASSRSLHAFKHQLLSLFRFFFYSLLFVFFASPRCLRTFSMAVFFASTTNKTRVNHL